MSATDSPIPMFTALYTGSIAGGCAISGLLTIGASLYHYILLRKGYPVSHVAWMVCGVLLSTFMAFFFSALFSIAGITHMAVQLGGTIISLLARFAWLWLLMMIAAGFDVTQERSIPPKVAKSLIVVYVLLGISLGFLLLMVIVSAFIPSAVASTRSVTGSSVGIAIIILMVVYVVITIVGLILYLVRFFQAIHETREIVNQLPVSPARKELFTTKYTRFLLVAVICILAYLIFFVMGFIAVIMFSALLLGVVQLLTALLSVGFQVFLFITFRATQDESLKLYAGNQNQYMTNDVGGVDDFQDEF